ncbi:MAG: nitroreductase family protein [Deltaproteobacteria bacterium]|nr:nitroreductase family protein [Deltaproteobacteria bacterium]
MDVLEAISTRRSVRIFKSEPVGGDLVERLLTAAMEAPSAGNEAPWHFVVVTEKRLLEKIPYINPNAPMAKRAPLGILVCADLLLEKFPGNWVLDCAAAAQNILLAARGLGLGAVWTGVYPEKSRMDGFRSLFGLPENIMPHTYIPVGWPASNPKAQDRFNRERIHKNAWQGEWP